MFFVHSAAADNKIASEVCTIGDVKKGRFKKIDDADRIVRDPERARARTMDRAVRLLAAKPRSVGELRIRLLEKHWTNEELVDEILEKLAGYGYLNDLEFSTSLAASQLRRNPQGKRRLKHTLAQKHLDPQIINEAAEAAYKAIPEADLIDAAIEKRIRIKGAPRSREEVKKLIDYLLRRGFDFALINEKLAGIIRQSDGE